MIRLQTLYFPQDRKIQIKVIIYLIIIFISTIVLNAFPWKRYSEIEISKKLSENRENQSRYYYKVTNKTNSLLVNYQLYLKIDQNRKDCWGNLHHSTPSGTLIPKKKHRVFTEGENWIRFGGPQEPLTNGASIWIYCDNLSDEAISSIEAKFKADNFAKYETWEMKIVKYNKFFLALKFFLWLIICVFGSLSGGKIIMIKVSIYENKKEK